MAQASFDFEKTLGPGKAIAELNLKNVEKFVSFNVDLYTKYTTLALANTKEALTISDVDSAQAYFTKQSEKSKETMETLVADANSAVEMGKAYSEELQALLTDLGEQVAETVAETVEAAPAAAPAKKAPAKKPAAKKAAPKAA